MLRVRLISVCLNTKKHLIHNFRNYIVSNRYFQQSDYYFTTLETQLTESGSCGLFKIGFTDYFFYNLVVLIKLCKIQYLN